MKLTHSSRPRWIIFHILIPILVAQPLLLSQLPDSRATTITGVAADERGSPTQGLVTIVSGADIRRQLTAADGAFRFDGLPNGKYFLCGKAAPTVFNPKEPGIPGEQPFDSCEWLSADTPSVTISNSRTPAGVRVSLRQGSLLRIRVEDPAGLTKRGAGRHSGNELSLRISGPQGIVHRIPILDEDAKGRNYGLVVPYDTPLDLQFQSRVATLRDNGGRDLSSGRLPVRVQKGGPRADYSFVASPRSAR